MAGRISNGARDQKWGDEIASGLQAKADRGATVVIRNSVVVIDRAGEAHYDKRQAGSPEGQPDK